MNTIDLALNCGWCVMLFHITVNFFVYRRTKGTNRDIVKKQGLAYSVIMKLLKLGGYLNKGYPICSSINFLLL